MADFTGKEKTDFLSKQNLYLFEVWKYCVFFWEKRFCFLKRNKTYLIHNLFPVYFSKCLGHSLLILGMMFDDYFQLSTGIYHLGKLLFTFLLHCPFISLISLYKALFKLSLLSH